MDGPGTGLIASGISTGEVSEECWPKGKDITPTKVDQTFGWTPLITAIYHRKEDVVILVAPCTRRRMVNLGDPRK